MVLLIQVLFSSVSVVENDSFRCGGLAEKIKNMRAVAFKKVMDIGCEFGDIVCCFDPGHIGAWAADSMINAVEADFQRIIEKENRVAVCEAKFKGIFVVAVDDPAVSLHDGVQTAEEFFVGDRGFIFVPVKHIEVIEGYSGFGMELSREGAFAGTGTADDEYFLHINMASLVTVCPSIG